MEVQTIPLAAHENDMARNHKVIKWLVVGWAITVIVMTSAIYSLSYGWEETTTTTTTTTEETTTDESVTQDSGDDGSNVYAGGDYYGDANGE